LASGAKSAVVEYKADKNVWPNSNTQAGLAPTPTDIKGNAVYSVEVLPSADGKIRVTFDNKVDSKILELWAVENLGSYEWKCSPTDTGGATTVPEKWLPSRCR
jgi:hypothetical protein